MSDTQQFKTPIYIRNSTKAYYHRVRNDPVKYQVYLEKRSAYQKCYYTKKQLKLYSDKFNNCEDDKKELYQSKIDLYKDKLDKFETEKNDLLTN